MIRTIRHFGALFAGLAIVIIGNALFASLTPLRAHAESFPQSVIGLIGSAYYAGYVLSCWKMPALLRRLGHRGAFAVLCIGTAAVALVQGALPLPLVWLAARFLVGFCSAGIYLICESWLNDQATNATRGVSMSAYTIINYAAVASGQLLITLAPVTAFTLFAAVAGLSLLAALPLALQRGPQPRIPARMPVRLRALYAVAPVGLTGSFVVGCTNSALWTLGPLYGIGKGLGAGQSATLMSVLVIAGAASQWPFGRLSDLIDRRIVLVSAIFAALFFGQVLMNVPMGQTGIFILAAVFGFFFLSVYTMVASCAYDEAGSGQAVEMASAVLLVNGFGSVLGPVIASAMMQQFGPGALFGYFAIVHVAFIGFVVTKIMTHRVA